MITLEQTAPFIGGAADNTTRRVRTIYVDREGYVWPEQVVVEVRKPVGSFFRRAPEKAEVKVCVETQTYRHREVWVHTGYMNVYVHESASEEQVIAATKKAIL